MPFDSKSAKKSDKKPKRGPAKKKAFASKKRWKCAMEKY
jgi:hypothetical protein